MGPTGAGKSTPAQLVTRLYDPDAGTVLIDGHDLRDVTLHSLHRQVRVVPEEPFLFAGTLRDNIAFARPSVPDETIRAAVDAVGRRDLVDRSPDGLHSILHERGRVGVVRGTAADRPGAGLRGRAARGGPGRGDVEQGTHEELVAAGGRYAAMYATWESHTAI